MSKFEIGDKVVDIKTGDTGIIVGEVVGEQYPAWNVEWETGFGGTYWQWEDKLELADKHEYADLHNAMKETKVAEETSEEITAAGMLQEAKDCLVARGVERDKPNGERSMKSTVEAFNALTGHSLSESNGWLFMLCLKAARAEGGCFKADDYVDGAAYFALYGEAAAKEAESS
jgi:hypothetical protein